MSDRTITCPFCGVAMQLRDRHGVEIDVCPGCRGVWLDRSELDSIIERAGRFLEIPNEDQVLERPGARRRDQDRDRFEWI